MFFRIPFKERNMILLVQLIALLTIIVEGSKPILSQNELREKYGQENTTFNDGRSCNRVCDGVEKTCYYEFNVQTYDTMSDLCGTCGSGAISDCFKKGCVTGNGIARVMMTINHQLPGPSINVCKNDRIIVDVINHMPGQELSIHWHGPHQKKTPWFDGVPMVTQCPMFAGNSFRYVFNAREAGTHFYHAHSGIHRSNGLFGQLNVRDPDDPNRDLYDLDLPEHTILLADWNNVTAEEKAPGVITVFTDALKPDSILINGFGSYHDSQLNTYKYAPMAVFYVEKGKRHRLRIGNVASLNCPLEFSIQNHNLTVIAMDSFPIEPVVADSVVTSAGERIDVVLNVDDLNTNEVLLTVRALAICRNVGLQEFARIIFVDDIINYNKKIEDHEPITIRPSYESQDHPKILLNSPYVDCTKPNSNCAASLKQKQIPPPIGGNLRNETAKQIRLAFDLYKIKRQQRPSNYKTIGRTPNVGVINNISSTHAPVPGLTQDDSEVEYCNQDNLPANCNSTSVCYCPHLIELELCKVYEILLVDGRVKGFGVNHPIHFHGYAFQVIDMGTKTQLASGNTPFANATHLPAVKDTMIIPTYGFTKIRFRACNPGYWTIHCHLETHMHIGMTVILKVGNRSDFPKPPAGFPTCGNFFAPVHESD